MSWGEMDERAKVDAIGKAIYPPTAEADRQVVERLTEIAVKRGVEMSQIALAWLLQKEQVTAPIVGTTEISHIEDAVAAVSLKLTAEEIAMLEEPYVPHPVLDMTF
ncbi:MAG TPA: aldo/keto reductase [Bacillus sp. (in: firmicutes)]|jgi:aryl-alcohol dehydrogenase-like predicted oxidoreductase|nr:aldo/keto reductase [Bacillus sp. (in: firmicutes)]